MSRRLLVLTCLMVATGGYLRLVAAADLVPAANALQALPLQIADWRGRDDGRLDAETEAILAADAYTQRTYVRSVLPVSLFVAYYATQRSGHTIHSPLNCLPGTGWEWVERGRQRLAVEGGEIEVNRNIARKNGQLALVYYWYQSHGRSVASDYRNKLLLVGDSLIHHRSDGALVRVTAPIVAGAGSLPDETAAFITAVYPVLVHHLPE